MWSEFEKIYNKLQDEESRFIFMKRLNNKDMEYLYEMTKQIGKIVVKIQRCQKPTTTALLSRY